MKPKHNLLRNALVLSAGAFGAWSLAAQSVGQWDFDAGNLNATSGSPLTFKDAATQASSQFGTTTALGLPDIGGQPAKVLKVPASADLAGGLGLPVGPNPSGGGTLVSTWTLVLDVLYPAASTGKLRSILDASDFNVDSEVFVTAANAFGTKTAGGGALAANKWYRVAFVVDAAASRVRSYVDGVEVNSTTVAGLVDTRFSLIPGSLTTLFADDNGESAETYVNSIQFRDVALSKGQVLALGGATAAGIPVTLPPVPSGLEKWVPGGKFASRTTPIGAVISTGSTTIQDSTIALKLDGAAVAGPAITRSGELITVVKTPASPFVTGTDHTVVLTYTDSLAGVRSFTNTFTAALFYEDFEGLALVPRLDEVNDATAAFEQAWTNRPPAGWKVDNSKFLATLIGPDNPDDDGDGYADLDGRTEWAGWSFANKDFWVAADNQRRAEFSFASGTVAIADPDEWDDQNHIESLFNSFLKTPEIPLDGIAPGTAFLTFASSWRPEAFDDGLPKFPVDAAGNPINNQTAIVTVSYDGAAPVQVLKFDSKEGSPTFHGDFPNEQVLVQLNNPAGAKKMVLSFELRDGANDWWWAVDNVVINAGSQPPVIGTQPTDIEVLEGQPAPFTAVASGDGLTYQWFKGSGSARTAIAGATTASYSITSAKLTDSGAYSVDVKNSAGTTTSKVVQLSVQVNLAGRLVLLSEDFNGLALGANVDEALAGTAVWTKTAPAGWTIDDTGVPGVGTDQDGITEWAGWSFASREWWASTAGNQRRVEFLKGTGAIAIADSDEWDDVAHAAGNMNTLLKTKSISLAGAKAGSVAIKFDSSWRPEDPQRGTVSVAFDGGAPTVVLELNSSQSSPNYRPDSVNETISIPVNNPAGAKTMTVTFGYLETRNNWWWAFDNLVVAASPAPLFSEDFESIVLGPNVEEGITTGSGGAKPNVWSKAGPAGWTHDDTGVPGLGTANDGVTEWAGWSFANREWWASTAGNQRRAEFLKGTGAVAIADSDEWDDIKPHAAGNMATYLATPAIDITGQAAGTVYLKFDSSWRPEEPQKATVVASYDGGAPVEVLRWESAAGKPFFHDDNSVNETVNIPLFNPAGAKSVKLTFGYFDTLNNWWWAIDNIEVNVGPAAVAPLGGTTASVTPAGIVLNWTGGNGPFLVQGKLGVTDAWIDLQTTTAHTTTIPTASFAGFFRIVDGTTKTVKLFKASLSGANERPTAVTTTGTGTGLLALDGLTATYVVGYQGLTAAPVAYHLHGLGGADAAVGVKFALVPSGALGTSGLFVGQATVDQATADGIAAGQTYFNLHTAAFGGGEIRGQVVP